MHFAALFDELLVRPDYATARADIIGGIYAFRVWTRLGWQEVKRRYRRTVFGPFWATLSIGAFIGGMVFIWAPLFKTDVSSYLPFLSAGMVAWTFATALISEGCGTYTAGISLITQLNFPYTMLNFMVVWRNVIAQLHYVATILEHEQCCDGVAGPQWGARCQKVCSGQERGLCCGWGRRRALAIYM